MADVRVLVAHNQGVDSRCEDSLAEAFTDSEGRFLFDAVTEKLSIGEVIKQLDTNWQVCVEQKSATDEETDTRLVWYDQHTGVLFNREPTELICDLGNQQNTGADRPRRFTGDAAELACRSTRAQERSPEQLDSLN